MVQNEKLLYKMSLSGRKNSIKYYNWKKNFKKISKCFSKIYKIKMYVSLKEIVNKYNISIKGIIHLGGCKGEELFSYLRNDIKNVILVEANPELIKILKIKVFFIILLQK